MANWQRHMTVADVWDSNDVHLIASVAAERLSELEPFTDYPYIEDMRQELVLDLQAIADDPDTDVRDFDYIWSKLYDWGDIALDRDFNGRKVCWIATF